MEYINPERTKSEKFTLLKAQHNRSMLKPSIITGPKTESDYPCEKHVMSKE